MKLNNESHVGHIKDDEMLSWFRDNCLYYFVGNLTCHLPKFFRYQIFPAACCECHGEFYFLIGCFTEPF